MSIQSKPIDKKVTVRTIQKMKGVEPIVMITAYDALFASLFEKEAEMILVGDSLNMSFMGRKDTISATLEQMIYHTQAVCNGATLPIVVLDMPFGTFNTPDEALKNAVRVYQETSAEAIKIEGGKEKAEIISKLCSNGIAVVGHIGLMPHFVRAEGGYRVRGKSEDDILSIIDDAKAIEEAGAFALIVEGVTTEAAKRVTESVSIPTIGIGAGNATDGQVLVWSDMLGLFQDFKPKFVKEYLDGADIVKRAVMRYRDEVKRGIFPSQEYSYN